MAAAAVSGVLVDLAVLYGQLSLLALGGGPTIVPEMQRQIVEVHGWMTAREFAALFALAQAAPGPNMLVATLVGLHVAGVAGALVATLGLVTPSTMLRLFALTVWERFRDAPWRRAVQAGLVPATVGLFVAAALLIAQAADPTWSAGAKAGQPPTEAQLQAHAQALATAMNVSPDKLMVVLEKYRPAPPTDRGAGPGSKS